MSFAYPTYASAMPVPGVHERYQAKAYLELPNGTTSDARELLASMVLMHVGISEAENLLSTMTAVEAADEKPNQTALDNARSILEAAVLFGIVPSLVTATVDGGVGLCFRNGSKYADVECFNNGETWGLISDRVNPAVTWPLDNSLPDAIDSLLKIDHELNA
jgi:hypothetical protein